MAAPLLEEQLGWGATKRHVSFVEELRLSLGRSGNVCPKALLVEDLDGDGCNEVAVATTAGELFAWRRLGCEDWRPGGVMESTGMASSSPARGKGESERGGGRDSERGSERMGENERGNGREGESTSQTESETVSEKEREKEREKEGGGSGRQGMSVCEVLERVVSDRSTEYDNHFTDGREEEGEWNLCVCRGLGTVTSLAVGDVRNCGHSSLVACSAEGQCFVFDFEARYLSATEMSGVYEISPADEAEIPVNTAVAELWDVDGRGETDLIIGTTDRKVQALRLQQERRSGELRFLQRGCWQLKEQVVSLCRCDHYVVSENSRPQRVIIAGLQGGLYAVVSNYTGLSGVVYRQAASVVTKVAGGGDPMQELLSLGGLQPQRNAIQGPKSNTLLTEVAVCRTRSRYKRELHVVCSNMAGNVVAQGMDGSIEWERQLGKQIFSLSAVDITGDGNEEVVVTSVDGVTFIIDCRSGEFLTHKLRFPSHCFHGISASVAALLEDPDGAPMPCLLYVTFAGELLVYLNASVETIAAVPIALPLQDRVRAADHALGTSSQGESHQERLRAALYGIHIAERQVDQQMAILENIRIEKARLQHLLGRTDGNGGEETMEEEEMERDIPSRGPPIALLSEDDSSSSGDENAGGIALSDILE